MKKRKIYFFELMFNEKINTAICKWALICAVGYFVIRTLLYIFKIV